MESLPCQNERSTITRLLEYEAQTGRNLLEEELGLDAKTQRMDSSFVGSFIKQMSRLELIVKVLQNFSRDLDEKGQSRWNPLVKEYVETDSKCNARSTRKSSHLL